MRSCEDVKMFDRPPLLQEPFAQTLSGKDKPKFQNANDALKEMQQGNIGKKHGALGDTKSRCRQN